MDRLDRILDKLTDMAVDIGRMALSVEKNTEDIGEHIRRTDLLEKKLDTYEEKYDDRLEEALLPIRWGKLTLKFTGWLAAIFGVAESIRHLFF